ncbi:ParB N-terminal domain-containing protein [Nocardia bovistercoris]|uniref:ParB N-terminal domain-containing protein n=1 Tax=Nocardia bovistercoris TaxID=2785916 RepID=A0A931IFL9_9NOCA|nr:ParB N-terminal domain-containing protein [Nocardia bovistercoris]MBH0778803.1 ParB N-terminal domain-containing protein [Nocardia bovistercoris]
MTEVAVKDLTQYPGNARRGDVPLIAESLKANGQYRPIVVQKSTGYVLAGNHTLQAAASLGWKQIDVHYVDVDDETARRIVLADNRTGDKGGYDVADLLALLEELPDLEGTGYTDADLADLVAAADAVGDGDDDNEPAPPSAVISYNLIFDDEDQQETWFEFLKWLKRTYSDKDTIADRLTEYLEATAGDRA